MPRSVQLYKCLLISPSDVRPEREAVVQAIQRWNGHIGDGLGIEVRIVRWEDHALPRAGARPQETINLDLVDTVDFGLALFWTKLGSPTGTHDSGSLEEMERLLAAEKPLLVYRKTAAMPVDHDIEQFRRLKEHLAKQYKSAIVASFDGPEELRETVTLHITSVLTRLKLSAAGGRTGPDRDDLVTMPRPDVRVRIHHVLANDPRFGESMLKVAVENHSPSAYFHSGFTFGLGDDRGVAILKDHYTHDTNGARRIEPGDATHIFVDARRVVASTDGEIPKCARSTDAIGRSFDADEEETRGAFERALRDPR